MSQLFIISVLKSFPRERTALADMQEQRFCHFLFNLYFLCQLFGFNFFVSLFSCFHSLFGPQNPKNLTPNLTNIYYSCIIGHSLWQQLLMVEFDCNACMLFSPKMAFFFLCIYINTALISLERRQLNVDCCLCNFQLQQNSPKGSVTLN